MPVIPEHLELDSAPLGVLVWRLDQHAVVLSSAAVGGGRTDARWIVNARVPSDYARTDLDVHVAEIADAAGVHGPGVGLLTAAPVSNPGTGEDGGVRVDATAGVRQPTWAAADEPTDEPPTPGTINIVAQLPVTLEEGAAVNAAMTVTEAKTQAMIDAGLPGTGTASDAVAIVWSAAPGRERASFCGPRSTWGARLARATHQAVTQTISGAAR